jgi:hypothetical protein
MPKETEDLCNKHEVRAEGEEIMIGAKSNDKINT